jgi:hypothetical protein
MPGKTMPRTRMKLMRVILEGMMALVRRWEKRYDNPTDYRPGEVHGGLHQASQSLKAMIENDDYRPRLHHIRLKDLPQVPGLSETYVSEMLAAD